MTSPSITPASTLCLGGETLDPYTPSFCHELSGLERFVLAWAIDLPTPKPCPFDTLLRSSSKPSSPVTLPLVPLKRKRTPFTELDPPAQRRLVMPSGKKKALERSRGTRLSDSELDEDTASEQTPIAIQPRTRNQSRNQLQSLPQFQAPHVHLGQIPDLGSGSANESSPSRLSRDSRTSSPSKASRASSPRKTRTATLQALDEYPINVMQYQSMDDLPKDVHPVFQDIFGIFNGLPVIPKVWRVRITSSTIRGMLIRSSLLGLL